MKELNSSTTKLLSGVEEFVAGVTDVELYIFGSSATRVTAPPSDIDVLLVYPDSHLSRGHDLAETIRELPVAEIHDVLALSKSEERELEFIDNQRAIRIWPAARKKGSMSDADAGKQRQQSELGRRQ
jgi:predicted nucleotidyltransferase